MSTASTRQQKRAPVTLKIKFKSSTLEQFVERYSVDISQGGIFIRTKSPLEVGTPLRFEFQLKDATPLITGEGTVVWTREHDPARRGLAPGMGVRFDRLPVESQQVLNKILDAKRAQPEPELDDLEEEFTDSPTRVAPRDVIQGLADGSRDFGDDNVPADAFEEATKVGLLDDLVAATAAPEEGGDDDDDDEDEPILTSAAREPAHSGEPIGRASSQPPEPAGDEMGLAPSRPADVDEQEMGLAPSPRWGADAETPSDFDNEPPLGFGDDVPLTPRPKDDFPDHIPTELNVAPPPPERGVSEEAPTALALQHPTPADVENARSHSASVPPSSAASPLARGPAASATEVVDTVRPPPRPDTGSNVIWFALAAIILGAAGFGGWWILSQRDQETAASQPPEPTGQQPDPGLTPPAPVADAAAAPEPEGLEATVASAVPGAVASLVDGDQEGPTPMVFKGLEEGKTYKVRVSAPGYLPAEVELTGGAEPKGPVELEAKPRVISVKSTPAGALVYVNKRRQGRTPVEVKLEGRLADADSYKVQIRRSGYESVEKVVEANAGWAEEDERLVASLEVALDRRRHIVRNPADNGSSAKPDKTDAGDKASGDKGSGDEGSGEDASKPDDTVAPDWAKKDKQKSGGDAKKDDGPKKDAKKPAPAGASGGAGAAPSSDDGAGGEGG